MTIGTFGADAPVAKTCKDCGATKALTEFYVNPKSGPIACCKPCAVERATRQAAQLDPELRRQRSRESARRNPVSRRANHDRWKYGVLWGFRQALWSSQNGQCAICSCAIEVLGGHIDHDHATGRIRGMLCRDCNNGLGAFKDSVDNLAIAVEYLKRTDDLRTSIQPVDINYKNRIKPQGA
jgi:hypothetical protein